MAISVYVGGLPLDAQPHEVEALFSPFGDVLCTNVLRSAFSVVSAAFARVHMLNGDHAAMAARALHGREFRGRLLTVHVISTAAGPHPSTRRSPPLH